MGIRPASGSVVWVGPDTGSAGIELPVPFAGRPEPSGSGGHDHRVLAAQSRTHRGDGSVIYSN